MAKKLRIPRLVPDGMRCKVVTEAAAPKRQGRRPDAERLAAEPWRADGYGSAYRKARQEVMERQGGRCAVTGEQVAVKGGGTWRIVQPGAGVHHLTALRDEGGADPANLVLLSASAHARADAERRRGEGSK